MARNLPTKLSPAQLRRLVELRYGNPPTQIRALAYRFGISERTVYYYLARYRAAEALAKEAMGQEPN